MTYWIYILSSRSRVLYIGVTSNLQRRLAQHRAGGVTAYTAKHEAYRLVFCEQVSDVQAAIRREKQLKHWKRIRKLELIKSINPDWRDLAS